MSAFEFAWRSGDVHAPGAVAGGKELETESEARMSNANRGRLGNVGCVPSIIPA